MVSVALEEHLATERSLAVRYLLAKPLLDVDAASEEFRLVVRHGPWLVEYFDRTCGWTLTVDAAAGFARLAKRGADSIGSRPLRRPRGEGAPFDRRRYELLCHVCAELVRHPVTTVGLLANAVRAEAHLDTSRYGERGAFVDALRVLAAWGALRVTAGEVDAFAESEHANAILTADTARLHHLLISATAPSALADDLPVDDVIEQLTAEPRYADPTATTDDEVRHRWLRHRLGRRLLDEPVIHFDALSDPERDYVASISGRRWLRDRVVEAGLVLEERAEGLLPLDPDSVATDLRFPAAQGNAHQLALLLADRLVPQAVDGSRSLAHLSPEQLHAEVSAIFRKYPAWARGRREGDGPDRFASDAIDLLVAFGLARRERDGSVVALPALARYRVAAPVVASEPSLFGPDLVEEELA